VPPENAERRSGSGPNRAPLNLVPTWKIENVIHIQPHSPEIHTGFVRRRCRNPRCGVKLTRETDDARRAFCSYSCFAQHYRKLCVVCERPLRSKGRRPQRFCRQKCKSEFHRDPERFLAGWGGAATTLPDAVRNAVRNAHSTGLKINTKRDRPPRILAGPGADLDPINLAIDTETFAHVRRLNHRHWAEAAQVGPRTWPIDLVGGGDHGRTHRLNPKQEKTS
jgi:hypothetical protein